MVNALDHLRDYLTERLPGPIEDSAELLSVLVPAWPEIAGSGDEAMASTKLARIEEPHWDPPLLTFRIERHGAMAGGGSSRAEMQTWSVDVDKAEAHVETRGYRQVNAMQPRLDVEPIAAEIVSLVEGDIDDERLKWSADRSRVTVTVRRVIPTSGPKQTVEGRRKRFTKALVETMISAGWREVTGTLPCTWERAQN
jgi:hypothetical protein